MSGRLQRQASLFGFAFFKELTRLQDPTLGQIDLLLDDPELVAICSRALAGRRQRSRISSCVYGRERGQARAVVSIVVPSQS